MGTGKGLTPARGAAILVLGTALWGSSFVVIKEILPGINPAAICAVRFAIGAIALLPFVRLDRKLWRYGGELGLWCFAGFATQTIALKYTSAGRCAFITAMYVVIVPVLAAIFGHRVRGLVWAAAIVALVGCGLLCAEGGGPNVGDLWSLGTAITFAVYIYRLEVIAPKFGALPLAVAQIFPEAVMSGVWMAASPAPVVSYHWTGLIYLGLGATAATTWLQAVAQRVVPAPQAAVIFTLEPVFAAIFAFIFIGERLALRGIIGAALIIAAAIICQAPAILRADP